MKFEGSRTGAERGVVRFPCWTQRAVEAKERMAVAMPDNLILRNGGRPAGGSKGLKRKGIQVDDAEPLNRGPKNISSWEAYVRQSVLWV